MKPPPFILAALVLAGCAHQVARPAPPATIQLAKIPVSSPALLLKSADLESSPPPSATLLTVDSWLDDYFATIREFEEMEYRAALAAHPEWTPRIEAKRRVSEENENVARAAFIYLHRAGTDGIFWSDGNWIWNVLPCNCGKIHRIEAPGWADRFQQLTRACFALERISDEESRDAYLLAVFDLKASLRPAWKAQMERLKPGFLRFMREPAKNAAHH